MQFDLVDQKINATVVVDYLKGSFEQSFFGGNPLEYGFTNIGFQPSIRLQKDDLSVNAGVGLFYSAAQESGESKFFVYPQVTGSYKIVGDLMIAYAGIDGTLQQNSFKELVDQNFFVSPTLAIVPTDIRYDAYFGLKGKLANSVSYNVRGSYKNERNKLLFKSNGIDDDNVNLNGYVFGNSFAVVADNVKTISFFGELKADISKDISFGINGTFNSFTTDIQAEAWNLPALELNAQLDIVISPKWYAGTSLFFVGERKDQFIRSSLFIDYPFENATLNSYVDINANVGYKYNERFTFFIKGNNLANQQYQRWLNFPVQGIQVMAGASYKFDF
jgi:outer membrane receptor protein involved in Fe transport